MIFTPLALAGAGIFCIFTRFCARRCCNSSDATETADDDSECCLGCCPRVFEDHIPEEELRIPTRQPLAFYHSISSETLGNSLNSDENIELELFEFTSDEYRDTFTFQVHEDEEDLVIGDFKTPLKVDSSDDITKSEPMSSMSPPDLLFLTGDEAVMGYANFLKSTGKASQGPSVVDVEVFKSKSSAVTLNDEFSSMDDFDALYAQKLKEFLEKNNLPDRKEQIGRSNSGEKKVQFNSMMEVRPFKCE